MPFSCAVSHFYSIKSVINNFLFFMNTNQKRFVFIKLIVQTFQQKLNVLLLSQICVQTLVNIMGKALDQIFFYSLSGQWYHQALFCFMPAEVFSGKARHYPGFSGYSSGSPVVSLKIKSPQRLAGLPLGEHHGVSHKANGHTGAVSPV